MISLHAGSAREPHWRHWRGYSNDELRPQQREWLLHQGSLTARLIEMSANRFRVRVLGQSWGRPRFDERRVLGGRPAAVALIREVLLECVGEPCVFARSILPASSLIGAQRYLRRFGARSLGSALFGSRGFSRGDFEIALFDPLALPLPGELTGGRPLWGRRSLLRVNGRPFLVIEVFLPGFERASARSRG